ncbi:PKD domain-containing protein [bacterium]|nr:PKD domain-containing protein [bacterium]
MKRKVLIFSFLIGVGIFLGNSVFGAVLGAVEVADSPCTTTVIINSPLPQQTFFPGDNIFFSGAFKVTGCGNGLFFNKITFYLTEDKDMPIKKANACQDCLGAISATYETSSCNIKWCDEVRVIDEEQAEKLGYKFYKFGTIYPSDEASGQRPYIVNYNERFQIPSDICQQLGFSSGKNKIRLYVQYSGTHWAAHWHWNITYQPAYLFCHFLPFKTNHPPIADAGEDLAVKEGSWITLDGSGSYDPDGDPLTYQWSASDGKIVSPTSKVTSFQVPFLEKDEETRYIYVTLKVTDSKGASDSDTIIISVKKVKYVDVTLTSDLTGDWIWQTKPLTLTWNSENATSCRRWIEIWNPFENVKLKDTSLGDKIPYDNWTSDWNDELSGTITTYPGSGPPDPQTGAQPRNWIGKLWIYKIECKDTSGQDTKKVEIRVNVKPRPIWQEAF